MKISYKISLIPFGLLLAGCVPLTLQTRLSSTNPATASAEEGGYVAAAPSLMSGNNYALGPDAEGEMMNMGEHGGQSMKMPGHAGHSNPPAKPADHDAHEHNAPKQ